ncbi:MAG: lipid-A-disaccharide synthase [Acidobacteria bacterium]|nr:lipid-A-disaccharide synthase [Acidobacteriota bacterium]
MSNFGNAPHSKILMVAGEASGDMHAADVVNHLNHLSACASTAPPHFYGMGGGALRELGLSPLLPMEPVSVIGLVEVVRHLPQIWTTFQSLVRSLDQEHPTLAVLVDFPDFNLRLAKKIKQRGIPIVWYISPQLWAWREQRVHTFKHVVDRMLVLFPFEVEFYRKYDMEVTFVGHPLVDRVRITHPQLEVRQELGLTEGQRVVALLPGSRRSELKMYLEPMLVAAERLAQHNPQLHFVLPLARSLQPADLVPYLQRYRVPLTWRQGMSYELTHIAEAAVVASGTATLETALIGTPMIILGRVSRLTELWLRRVANLPYYGLVNFVMGEKCVTELIQQAVTPENIVTEVLRLLEDSAEQARLRACYTEIRHRLGDGGAAGRAAEAIWQMTVQG